MKPLYKHLFKFGSSWNSEALANSIGDVLTCEQLTDLVNVFVYSGHGPVGDMYIDAHEYRCDKKSDHPPRW